MAKRTLALALAAVLTLSFVACGKEKEEPEKALRKSLGRLKLEYVDLYLDHWPSCLNINDSEHKPLNVGNGILQREFLSRVHTLLFSPSRHYSTLPSFQAKYHSSPRCSEKWATWNGVGGGIIHHDS